MGLILVLLFAIVVVCSKMVKIISIVGVFLHLVKSINSTGTFYKSYGCYFMILGFNFSLLLVIVVFCSKLIIFICNLHVLMYLVKMYCSTGTFYKSKRLLFHCFGIDFNLLLVILVIYSKIIIIICNGSVLMHLVKFIALLVHFTKVEVTVSRSWLYF